MRRNNDEHLQAELLALFNGNQNLNQDNVDSALRHFAEEGNPNMVNFLLHQGYNGLIANHLATSDDGYTALDLATENRTMSDENEDENVISNFDECIAILTTRTTQQSKTTLSCRAQASSSEHRDNNGPPPPPSGACAIVAGHPSLAVNGNSIAA